MYSFYPPGCRNVSKGVPPETKAAMYHDGLQLARVMAGVVCWQVKLCDPHLSALEARFSQRGAIQIDHLYLAFYTINKELPKTRFELGIYAVL